MLQIKKNTEYSHYIKRKWLVLLMLLIVLVTVTLISISLGSSRLSIMEIIRVLFGGGDLTSRVIVFDARLPRIMTAIGVGFALALAGCIMQNVLRNPLASASTLGIAQGASFGAAFAIAFLGIGSGIHNFLQPSIVTIFAFFGGIVSTIIILILAKVKNINSSSMILMGVALSALFTSATTLIQYFSDDTLTASIVYWTFGDLGRTSWNQISLIYGLSFIALIYFIFNRWNYNAMESGLTTAKSLGVNVKGLTLIGMMLATLISAVAIAFVGTINFIGLIAPHIVRKFVGNDYRFLIPASAIMGAIIVLVADITSRMIVAPAILPIGAITSLLGAPLFLLLIMRKGKDIR